MWSPLCQLLITGPTPVQPNRSQWMRNLFQHSVQSLPTNIALSLKHKLTNPGCYGNTSQRLQHPNSPYPSARAPCGCLIGQEHSSHSESTRSLLGSKSSLEFTCRSCANNTDVVVGSWCRWDRRLVEISSEILSLSQNWVCGSIVSFWQSTLGQVLSSQVSKWVGNLTMFWEDFSVDS